MQNVSESGNGIIETSSTSGAEIGISPSVIEASLRLLGLGAHIKPFIKHCPTCGCKQRLYANNAEKQKAYRARKGKP